MNTQKKQLVRWIDEDRDLLIGFLSKFLQAKSSNPPRDTRDAARVITDFLGEESLPYRIIAPKKETVNIVGSFDCGRAGGVCLLLLQMISTILV